MQRSRAILLGKHWLDVGNSGEDREPRTPARCSVAEPEECGALDERSCLTQLAQSDHRLRQHQREILFEAFLEFPQPMRASILLARRRVDPDVSLAEVDIERSHVVSEWVEGTATREIEAGVVPMAGEDAIADRAPAQGEA